MRRSSLVLPVQDSVAGMAYSYTNSGGLATLLGTKVGYWDRAGHKGGAPLVAAHASEMGCTEAANAVGRMVGARVQRAW